MYICIRAVASNVGVKMCLKDCKKKTLFLLSNCDSISIFFLSRKKKCQTFQII